MLTQLHLHDFKNFRDATLSLGPFSVLIGENASGKSNVREAFRFLHGIGRGYSLAEIIGEKWVEGGVLQWKGIRGGIRELPYFGSPTICLECMWPIELRVPGFLHYQITVDCGPDRSPRLVAESLVFESNDSASAEPIFQAGLETTNGVEQLVYSFTLEKEEQKLIGPRQSPLLSNGTALDFLHSSHRRIIDQFSRFLTRIRFFDFDPNVMRMPSIPGQTILGDRGENLSSVLEAICETPTRKRAVIEWLKSLLPLDVVDFAFPPDAQGKVLLHLVEPNGQKTSAYSASDGTLRFLAIVAAIFGHKSQGVFFIEEIETGIHPTRLALLIQLIEQHVGSERLQVVATTHSPQLLSMLSEASRKDASLVFRLENRPDALIRRLLDIPEAERLAHSLDLSRLHSTGWFENTAEFLEGSQPQ